jgi:hypothetical protein
MKISTLKKCAQRSTSFRGHKMIWNPKFNHNAGLGQIGVCRNCQAEVLLLERPQANQIDIGGEAVAIDCKIS